jgi:hypothetical protein
MSETGFLNPFEGLSTEEAQTLADRLSAYAQEARKEILWETDSAGRIQEGVEKFEEAVRWDNYLKGGHTRAQVEAATAELEALQAVDIAKQTAAQRRRRRELCDFLGASTKGNSDHAREREASWRRGEGRPER